MINRFKNYFCLIYVSFVVSLCLFVPSLFIWKDLWSVTTQSIDYSKPTSNLNAIVISENNGSQFFDLFSVSNYTFPNGKTINLIPKENTINEWWGDNIFFIDQERKLFTAGTHYNEFIPADQNRIVGQYDQIIYYNLESYQKVVERLPEIANIPAAQFSKNNTSSARQPILQKVNPRELVGLFSRIFWLVFLLIFSVSLAYSFLKKQKISVGLPIIICLVLAIFLLASVFIAETKLFYGTEILMLITLTLLILKESGYQKDSFRQVIDEIVANNKVYLLAITIFLLIANASLILLPANPFTKYLFSGDVWRYLEQGRFITYFHGWPRDYFIQKHLASANVSTYPYAMGIVFSWLYYIAGFNSQHLLFPSWQMSLSSYFYLLLVWSLILSTIFLLVKSVYKHFVIFLPALIVYSMLYGLPIYVLGMKGIDIFVWLLLIQNYLILFSIPSGQEVRNYIPLLATPLLSLLLFLKNEAMIVTIFFLLPVLVLYYFSFASGKREKLLILLKDGAIIGAIAMFPILLFKARNAFSGINSTVYMPVNITNLRQNIADWPSLIKTILSYLNTYHVIWLLLMIGIANFLIFKKQGYLKQFVRDTVFKIIILFVYLVLISLIYVFSNYPSRILHLRQSFERLLIPAIIFIFFFDLIIYYLNRQTKNYQG